MEGKSQNGCYLGACARAGVSGAEPGSGCAQERTAEPFGTQEFLVREGAMPSSHGWLLDNVRVTPRCESQSGARPSLAWTTL